MEEQRAVEPDVLESPIESEATAGQDEVQAMKPVQVRVIPYPPGFKSVLERDGQKIEVFGEIIQVYHLMDRKRGQPRAGMMGLGMRAIVEEDPQLQETQKGAE